MLNEVYLANHCIFSIVISYRFYNVPARSIRSCAGHAQTPAVWLYYPVSRNSRACTTTPQVGIPDWV